jgi:hypothetical protein
VTLRKILTRFVHAVAEEAERNPVFRERVTEALRWPGEPGANFGNASRPKNRRPPAVFDPAEIAQQGEHILRARLATLSIEQLKDIVAQFGMDPGKLVVKWKTPDRIIERIVETSVSRAQKGDAFRAESKGRPDQSE